MLIASIVVIAIFLIFIITTYIITIKNYSFDIDGQKLKVHNQGSKLQISLNDKVVLKANMPQLIKGESYEVEINKKIFEGDVECIKKSDLLIFDLNGRVPDEGGCVELGMAYAWGIKSIGFKTDTRALDYTGDDNLMIEGCMNFKIARNLEELEKMLKEI